MCGIFCVHQYKGDIQQFKPTALTCSRALRHRGPDWSGNVILNNTILCHERLAIVGVESGAQPMVSNDGSLVLAVNGEIYNHKALRESLSEKVEFKTHSDCEVIMYLYREHGLNTPRLLDGMFSFVLLDVEHDRIVAARDPIGITTLYRGYCSDYPETVYFASELKALHLVCDRVEIFPPGHVFDSATMEMKRYFEPLWWNSAQVPTAGVDYTRLRASLEQAVRKRLMTEVPFGVLLSGGLDSSLIAAIVSREAAAAGSLAAAWPRVHSFSIGLEGSPDLVAAREVAEFLGTVHHEQVFTIEEGLDALRDVVFHLETFDVTTVRASVPMYLLARRIKAQGVKMVLSGEGSDEVFGGYLYFHNAPSASDFHQECVSRVKRLHLADCLRANKSTMAWGVEARVPFLDREFLEEAMAIDPREKMAGQGRIEKYVLRRAFDVDGTYLPDRILWRQKEQFSDGVGYSWIDALRARAAIEVGERDDSEAVWYRQIFDEFFPKGCADTVERWEPRTDWNCPKDPSGRAQRVHLQHVK